MVFMCVDPRYFRMLGGSERRRRSVTTYQNLPPARPVESVPVADQSFALRSYGFVVAGPPSVLMVGYVALAGTDWSEVGLDLPAYILHDRRAYQRRSL